jgi:hypothetical protein
LDGNVVPLKNLDYFVQWFAEEIDRSSANEIAGCAAVLIEVYIFANAFEPDT